MQDRVNTVKCRIRDNFIYRDVLLPFIITEALSYLHYQNIPVVYIILHSTVLRG